MNAGKIVVVMLFLILAASYIPFTPIAAESSDLWAVVVGVEGGGAIHLDDDAVDFANVLQSVYGYPSSNIRLLINSEATKDAVLNALVWAKNQASNNDALAIFFSTHGNNDLLHLYDDVLTENELYACLSEMSSHNILVVINACSSGSFLDLAEAVKTGILVTACRADELTYDIPLFGNTIFVEYFVDRGMSQGLADENGDSITTVEEAFNYACEHCADPPGALQATHPQMVDKYEEDFELGNPIHAPWFPSPFISQDNSLNSTIILASSTPHAPVGSAHTMDVMGAVMLAQKLGLSADSGTPTSAMDDYITTYSPSTATITILDTTNNLISVGGPGVNTVTKYYNDLLDGEDNHILPAYFMKDNSSTDCIYVAPTGNTYYVEYDEEDRKTADYGLIERYYDQVNGRMVLLVAGLGGEGTWAASKVLSTYQVWGFTGSVTIVKYYDSNGDGYLDEITLVS